VQVLFQWNALNRNSQKCSPVSLCSHSISHSPKLNFYICILYFWCLVLPPVEWPTKFRKNYPSAHIFGKFLPTNRKGFCENVWRVMNTSTYLWCVITVDIWPYMSTFVLIRSYCCNRNYTQVLTRREICTQFQTQMATFMAHVYTTTAYQLYHLVQDL